ncbi:hypothetical protein K9B32_14635, partial [Rhizobium sp. 3T7]|uniref:hypothetical protein n=1 Tax=Rhizobium sp. 3T7 TaxID=2874922 RepID=UPI001CCDB666
HGAATHSRSSEPMGEAGSVLLMSLSAGDQGGFALSEAWELVIDTTAQLPSHPRNRLPRVSHLSCLVLQT